MRLAGPPGVVYVCVPFIYIHIHPSVYLYIYLCSASEIYPERGGERDRDRRGRGARRAAGGGVRTPFIYLSIQPSSTVSNNSLHLSPVAVHEEDVLYSFHAEGTKKRNVLVGLHACG